MLIVIEGIHETAKADVIAHRDRLADQISSLWGGALVKGQIDTAVGDFDTDLALRT